MRATFPSSPANWWVRKHVFQLAISDTLGHANIHLLPDLNSGGSGLFRATKYSVPTQIVPVTTLSRLTELLRLPKIRLMKIDVEGFEYEAILGSKELFASGFIEHIALELHPTILAARGKSGDDITNFLSECGYQHDHRFRNLILTKNSAQNS